MDTIHSWLQSVVGWSHLKPGGEQKFLKVGSSIRADFFHTSQIARTIKSVFFPWRKRSQLHKINPRGFVPSNGV